MASELTTLTSKGQVTVPKTVRVNCDTLQWDLEDGSVRVRVLKPLDRLFLEGVEASLQEWNSAEDEEAFADL